MTEKPKVTVAIPTYNRSQWLGRAIQSVLSQSFSDFEIIVLDNASSDDTQAVAANFVDRRVHYVCNEHNLGMIGNWNRAIELATGSYLVIFGDDDSMLSEFLSSSVPVLENHPNVGFTFSHCNKVNEKREILRLWGYDFPPSGLLKGVDYLYWTVRFGCCLTNSSTVLFRRGVFDHVGSFKANLAQNTFDLNMYIRIATLYDVFFIDRVLADYTLHPGQVSQMHWRTKGHPTGRLGSILEIIDAVAVLLEIAGASEPQMRTFLATRLRALNSEGAALARELIPTL